MTVRRRLILNSIDLLAAAAENLWRMKLRSALTVSGVLIAIAAFVSMLSFGAGNQRYIDEQFEKFGLLSTIHVYPTDNDEAADSVKTRVLDDSALVELSHIPGVNLAYPFETFEVKVALGDSSVSVNAQAISSSVAQTRALSQFNAGGRFSSDSAMEVLVTRDFLEGVGISEPDSILGKKLHLTARLIRIDSALVALIRDQDGAVRKRIQELEFDSLFHEDYAKRVVRREVMAAIQRFVKGFFNAREAVAESLTVVGVLAGRHQSPIRIEQVVMPIATARRFNSGDLTATPSTLIDAMNSGSLPNFFSGDSKYYPKITLDLDPHVAYTSVRDSVKALGFKTFSFADQFADMQRFLMFFDLALGLVGLIALTTASLGITNTMLMSILERRREIGVLKALGADDSHIRKIFLFEASAIGTLGASLGILVGWAISRIASAIAKYAMSKEGIEPLELFAVPWWLIGIALGFGIIVSLVAGYYPARRAARLDPVEALRND